MQPAKVKVYVALFCYGGNGGLAMMAPELGIWLAKTYHEMLLDERISSVGIKVYSDTPITMTRNRAVRDAQLLGCDMVLMLDSDNEPDGYMSCGGDAKPFWKTAFDFSYDRLIQGVPTVIAAPYCGPPPEPIEKHNVVTVGDVTFSEIYGGEVPYLFEWANRESDNPHTNLKIDLMTRNQASRLSGIFPVAALPTGVCLFTLSAFKGLPKPYFRYEMNEDGSEKQSTEDVVATRDISLYWKATKGIDVLYATCDSWALHHKTKKVGRPQFVPVESVATTLVEAIKNDYHANEAMEYIDYTANSKPHVLTRKSEVLSHDVEEVVISDMDMRIAQQLAERDRLPERGETIEDEDVWEPAEPEVPSYDGPQNGNGAYEPTLTHKMVAGKKVAVFNGFEVPDESLDSVEAMTQFLISRQGKGPLEVAVLGSGTGQCTAILNSTLPEGSHIYALDCIIPHKCSPIPAEQFKTTFQEEISRGRIQPDNDSRKMPYPVNKLHLDMVFIEQFITEDKLQAWLRNVQPGGLIAGLGYGTDASRRTVNRFAKKNDLLVKDSGDVWAIPLAAPQSKEPEPDDDERVDLESLNDLT